MGYLIDSDVVIDYLEGDVHAATALGALASDAIMISIFTYMEVYQGRLRSDDPVRAEQQLSDFLGDVPVLSFSPAAARRCAELRHAMASRGVRVRSRAIDLMSAAIALEHDLTLVTRNVRDYADIPGIRLYEW